jgi:hypothetical protein
MIDYRIQPHSRRCCITGRDLQPGEKYFSALVDEDHQLVRKDYSSEAWQGPPQGAFGYWAGRISRESEGRRPHIDDDLLLECFHRLENQTDLSKLSFRYVAALLLMRRKRFRFTDAQLVNGQEVLVVLCSRDKKKYEVINPQLSEQQIADVQEEVFRVLGWG